MLHCNEVAGHDIRASPDGLWRAIAQGNGKISPIVVDAGPIHHRGNVLLEIWSTITTADLVAVRSLYRLHILRNPVSF